MRLAYALTHEMPFLLELLERGVLSERRAALVVGECVALSLEQRARVDAELAHTVWRAAGTAQREGADRPSAGDHLSAGRAGGGGPGGLRGEGTPSDVAAGTGHDVLAHRAAAGDQGVGVLAALTRAVDSARVAGDARGRGQVMADTLVERVTGQAVADAVPVEVQLVVTDRTPPVR